MEWAFIPPLPSPAHKLALLCLTLVPAVPVVIMVTSLLQVEAGATAAVPSTKAFYPESCRLLTALVGNWNGGYNTRHICLSSGISLWVK